MYSCLKISLWLLKTITEHDTDGKLRFGDFLFLSDEMIDMDSYHSGDDHNYSDILLLEVYIFKPPNQYGNEI